MRRILLLLALLLSQAPSAEPVAVPAPLQPWHDWALDGEEFRDCALLAGNAGASAQDFVCAWPGQLQVEARADGAQFAMSWRVQAESWVPLPGNGEFWPQDVRVDGQAAEVVMHDGMPQMRLTPGQHSVTGRFGWTHRPQSLTVPAAIGLVRLQVDGQAIAPVQHQGNELVLGRGVSEAPEADALELRVYRRLHDDVPMTLSTVIRIGASGQAREEVLGPVLPNGFVPTSISVDAGWPARIEADGRLRVQVQPDTTEIHIEARASKPLSNATIAAIAKPWPEQEIWSYAGNPEQRVSSASGPPQVDPEQAQVPEAWRELPAFALTPGAMLTIDVRSRGLGANESNRLQLNREAWLDFSGDGWTVRDTINGEMHQGWRLDAQPPFRLEDARDVSRDQALLVTEGDDHATGVEWRTPQVNLSAGLRVQPAAWELPVGGWRQTFDAVNTSLHLPHGYRLLAAPGADVAEGSWVSRWTLLDIFLVALVVLFAWRAFGLAGAAIALGYFLVDYHESGAPLYSLGLVLGLGLLLRVLPEGRLQRFGGWLRLASLALLALLIVPFAATQLRLALYPQLEGNIVQPAYPMSSFAQGGENAIEPPPPVAMAAPAPESPALADEPASASDAAAVSGELAQRELNAAQQERKALEKVEVTGSRIKRVEMMESYSQTTIVQAGRGLPSWRGGPSYRLSWSGPVTAEQSVRLLVAPPWLTRLLRVLAVVALAWLLLRASGARLPRLPRANAPALASLLLLSLAVSAMPLPAQAQAMPDSQLLQQLHDRLIRAPKCAPDCAAIANARVTAHDDQLQVALDVQAASDVAVPVPTDAKTLSLDSIEVDGAVANTAAGNGANLLVPLSRGVHRLLLTYRISGDRVALAFAMTPHAIEFSSDGWQASGITDGRLLTETLGLNRLRNAGSEGKAAAPAQEFPPYVRVQRTITFGLDWSVSNSVQRVAPEQGGFSVRLPVIAGEKVITSGLLVRQGILEIPLPDGSNSANWQSTLDKADTLTLRAPDLADHAEVWRVRVSPLWRAKFSGVPESVPQQEAGDDWHEFVFHPLPGEVLTITVTRPAAVAGSTQAIESVHLQTIVGKRASEYVLSLQVRASQGGERVLGLPAKAELLAVTRDGDSMNLRLENGKLSLPLKPGQQNYQVRFRDQNSVGLHNQTPSLLLGVPAANIDLEVALPEDRWVLITHGPQSGPAVLYWGELLVLLLVAYGLSKLPWTPLKLRQWLLLGMGFSTLTFSWIAMGIVVAWLFALAWRERRGAGLGGKFLFDAIQIVLVWLTIAAAMVLVNSLHDGLLGAPAMHIDNPLGGDGALRWFADQSHDALPRAGVISLPLWLYRAAMLAWALWLANAVLGWLRWGIRAWTQGGYWRPLRAAKPVPAPPPAPAEDPANPE